MSETIPCPYCGDPDYVACGCGRSATSPEYRPTQADPDPHHEDPSAYCDACGYLVEHCDECPNCGEPT